MSLIKKPTSTEKRISASRANGGRSLGPHTPQERKRLRAAHRRLGFVPLAEEVALRSLGEEPLRFQELLEGLWVEYEPSGASQEGLVVLLARALWLTNRADRMQEGIALRQAQEFNLGREDRVHAQMMRLKMTANTLRQLIYRVAREEYITHPTDWEIAQNLHREGVMREMGDIVLALFQQLQEPLQYDETGSPVESHAAQQKVLLRIKEIFGVTDGPHPTPGRSNQNPSQEGGEGAHEGAVPAAPPKPRPDPVVEMHKRYPYLTRADWQAREMARQLLENILARQVEVCESQHQALLKEALNGPSPYERAAEIAPTSRDVLQLRRMQDANFREVRRITNLLLKLKRNERLLKKPGAGSEKPDKAPTQDSAVTYDI